MIKNISTGENIFNIFNYLLLLLCVFVTLFPFINVVAVSLSSNRAILSGEVFLWPVEITVKAYKHLLNDGQLLKGMKNTVMITCAGTGLNLAGTILAAYTLSKKRLAGRKQILWMITFTMMFGGGLIPNFILIKQLSLMDSYWALWLPGLISTYNMLIMKTFFESIPVSLEEAASIDGANEVYILLRIILPLSMPVIATMTLFYAVGWWNSYFNVLLYITSTTKHSLMMKLMQMLNAGMVTANTQAVEGSAGALAEEQSIIQESIRSASIIIAVLPILCIYPFLQKYFVKGIMIGSIKG